ncbi:hypothetical protein Pyn_39942 [Prunus yedoensis var. nudiflora]|uniref:Uncharacterized protein n=1 Tax=Prunus yedoensis var. nudiflora TaxID=2094558 RepID=A0A314UK33_PRUYE|nr:hypothetical protein Pyn_39942 [Prunus yedoensis var. nudiflora]
MRGFAFFDRVSRAFHDYPSVPEVLVVVAVSENWPAAEVDNKKTGANQISFIFSSGHGAGGWVSEPFWSLGTVSATILIQ